jgi:Mn-dependent DtxR family transcriptional regulator
MFVAFQIDCPPGPAMVLVATVLFVGVVAFGPEHGVVAAWVRQRRIRQHILEEDVLRELALRAESPERAARDLVVALAPAGADAIERAVRRLERDRCVARSEGGVVLTDRGLPRALDLVRSHRLWETYLARKDVPIPNADVHQVAERLEHAHEMAEGLDELLGHPEVDPHGKPIPRRVGEQDSGDSQ